MTPASSERGVDARGASGGPWSGVRVVELTGLTGAYARGSGPRSAPTWSSPSPPRATCCATCRRSRRATDGASLWWTFFGQGKRSVVAPPGSAAREELVATADVVITDVDPGRATGAGPRSPGRRRHLAVRSDRPAPRLEGLRARRLGVGRDRHHDRVPGPTAAGAGDAGAVRGPRHVAVHGERGDARPARRAPDRSRPGRRHLDAGVLPVAGPRDRRVDVPRRPAAARPTRATAAP